MALFRNRYRIESARARWCDYRDGWHFVTINTWCRVPWFGKIADGRVVLTRVGYLVERLWREIPRHCRYARLDAFVVMPDHLHGIVIITPDGRNHWGRDVACNVSTDVGTSTKMSDISPTSHSLAAVIRSFKSAVARSARAMGVGEFRWQTRFHDRIIRDERELWAKRRYVRFNPMKHAPTEALHVMG